MLCDRLKWLKALEHQRKARQIVYVVEKSLFDKPKRKIIRLFVFHFLSFKEAIGLQQAYRSCTYVHSMLH